MIRMRESAPSRARRMIEQGCSVENVRECTGLPENIVQQIAAPILALREAEKTMRAAERRLESEQREKENRLLREQMPCPLCDTGHAVPNDYRLVLPGATVVAGEPSDIVADVHYCECSNPRCIAQLMYPRDTQVDAISAFILGQFSFPWSITDIHTGHRYRFSRWMMDKRIKEMFYRWPVEQVKRLGFDPQRIDRLAMEYSLERMEQHPEGLDDVILCPKCGGECEYRKAVNPVTHEKRPCWWRVACKKCGVKTKYAFPTQREAETAFETSDFERNPKT